MLDKIEGVVKNETTQGKKYRFSKKQGEDQGELFPDAGF